MDIALIMIVKGIAVIGDGEKYAAGMTVKPGTWCIRSGPGRNCAVVDYARGGDRLPKVETEGWQPVEHAGAVCWISKSALMEG